MTFEIYKGRNGQWRWRLRAGNNKVIATGGEGYARRRGCTRMIAKIGAGFRHKIVDV